MPAHAQQRNAPHLQIELQVEQVEGVRAAAVRQQRRVCVVVSTASGVVPSRYRYGCPRPDGTKYRGISARNLDQMQTTYALRCSYPVTYRSTYTTATVSRSSCEGSYKAMPNLCLADGRGGAVVPSRTQPTAPGIRQPRRCPVCACIRKQAPTIIDNGSHAHIRRKKTVHRT